MRQVAKLFLYKCLVIFSLLGALLLADAWLLGLLPFLGAVCLGIPCLLAAWVLTQKLQVKQSAKKSTSPNSRQLAPKAPVAPYRAA